MEQEVKPNMLWRESCLCPVRDMLVLNKKRDVVVVTA